MKKTLLSIPLVLLAAGGVTLSTVVSTRSAGPRLAVLQTNSVSNRTTTISGPALSAFRRAMLEQQIMTVPPDVTGPALTSTQREDIALHPSVANLRAMVTDGKAAISQQFSGSAEEQLGRALNVAKKNEADGGANIAAGVGHIHYKLVRVVSTDEVDITATMTVWSQFYMSQGPGRPNRLFSPSNGINMRAVMRRSSAGWRVASESWGFIPNEGP